MSFQEEVDPLVEKLQHAIDALSLDIKHQEFEEVLQKIYERFPFVDLSEFLDMYVNGEYSKVLIEKFHLSGYTEYSKLLRILKLASKRKSTQKTAQSKEINLKDQKLAKRYEFLQKILVKFNSSIKKNIRRNVLKAIILLQLYSIMPAFMDKKTIIRLIPNAIKDFEHLILAPHVQLSTTDNKKIVVLTNEILQELKDKLFLEIDDAGKFRLEKHQLKISDYILNTIRNREGITYQDLGTVIKNKLPILSQIPPSLFQLTLHDLISYNKIVKKEGYWKFKPSYDEYFTFDYYKKFAQENSFTYKKHQKFFGRKITPNEFIRELRQLEKGNFEDQDDQVTRIAGMILASSNMMRHPPNELEEFDFAIDLSNYEFTTEQQKVIRDFNIEIKSKTFYVKVMINDEITIEELSEMTLKLQQRKRDEQGFVISLAHNTLIEKMLKNDKIIQLISEKELLKWCKITQVMPSRRGAVVIVRQGDHKGNIVKIKSINYESGRADIILLPDMVESTQYIGALEEITLATNIEQFIDYSSKYFEFLRKLYKISKTDTFRSIVTDKFTNLSRMKEPPNIKITSNTMIECNFDGLSQTKIDFMKHPNIFTQMYSTDDLFSCTCFQWGQQSRTHGLCEHLIFVLNESIKKFLSYDASIFDMNMEQQLQRMEQRMDLFLNRLRYSSSGDSNAKCPHCGIIAHTLEQVRNLFGYRQMSKNDKFSLRRQSRCKKCRRANPNHS